MSLPNISIATSVRYGNYKQHFDDALFMVHTIVNKYDEIKQHIHLPRGLSIHLRPIRSVYGKAYYTTEEKNERSYRSYWMEIDVRQDDETFYDTLLHELVHIEQFYERRLEDPGIPEHFKWKGKVMEIKSCFLEEYNELPWEKEAIERAENLVEIIFKSK